MEDRPHMVVGIDLGMTCTGVSYANLSIGSETIRWVQKWPGRFQANENKVPTVVVYPTSDPSAPPSSWGFLSETAAEQNSTDKDYREWFKTMLDPSKLAQKQAEDPESAPSSMQEVERWYEDYLRRMYEYLSFKLGGELSGTDWPNARIEFIFSVPTTWPVLPTVESFKTIVSRSGFGTHPTHSVTIGLTEAEAAAVHVSTEAPGIFRENDILLVCDAGGGTTDLSVLRISSIVNQSITLQQLDVVFGETIGSAAIDYSFEQLVYARLSQAHAAQPLPAGIAPDDAAWEMMKSRDFQAVKCEYGSPDDTPLFSIAIPRCPHTYSYNSSESSASTSITTSPDPNSSPNPNANPNSPLPTTPSVLIKNGEMTFDRLDLQSLFDKQITKLIALITTQLTSLYQKYPSSPVAHLVLSGGLGNSAYVQTSLRSHFTNTPLPNAHSMRVRIAPDPQLAVCKGLVSNRIRHLLTSHSVLGWRCCRASYGTLCKILYDRKNPSHVNKQLVRDAMNGKLYIMQAIAWFVKKGEPVSVDRPIVHDFVKKVAPGDPRRAFPTSVVVSGLESGMLPDQMTHDTRVLCEIQSDLTTADESKFVEKNKRFWSLGKHYLKVEYQVRVLIGPADVRFELWFNNEKLSRDQSIKVDWVAAPAPDLSTYNRAELPDSRPAQLANGLAGTKRQDTSHEQTNFEKKKGIGGLVSMARGGKWPVYG